MKRILTVIGIAIGLFALGAEAHAAQKYSFRTKGNAASYSGYTSTECGYENLSVSVFEEKTSGNQTTYDSVYVDYSSFDFCTGEYTYGYGVLDGADFNVQNLQSASADGAGTMELTICTFSEEGEIPCVNTSAALAVNLDWVGTGETSKDRTVQTSTTPSARYRFTSTGQSRQATVTGSVTIDGVSPSFVDTYASLNRSSSASFEIIR